MTVRKLLLTLLTSFCVSACISLPLIPETGQPFDGSVAPGNKLALKVLPSSLGLPMPAGLQAGDVIEFADLAPRDRSFFMTLVVTRADGKHTVVVPFSQIGFLNGSLANRVTLLAGYILSSSWSRRSACC
jgi:hypothetical protein